MKSEDWLTWERIETFLALVEHGTFTKAASALGVGQSAVSRQIQRIEDEMGRRLFDRTKQGTALTSDGEAYLMFAKAMRDIGEGARRQFSVPPVDGRLRLGVAEAFARSALTQVLAIFFQQFPRYEIEMSCDSNARLMADFDEKQLDILLIDRLKGNGGELLRRVRLNWVGRSQTAFPVQDPVPLIVDAEREPLREVALGTLRDARRSWRIRFQSSSLAAQMAAAEAGIGVCAVGAAVPLQGVVVLNGESGLPPLPPIDIVMLCQSENGGATAGVDAMRGVVRSILSQLDHPGFLPKHAP